LSGINFAVRTIFLNNKKENWHEIKWPGKKKLCVAWICCLRHIFKSWAAGNTRRLQGKWSITQLNFLILTYVCFSQHYFKWNGEEEWPAVYPNLRHYNRGAVYAYFSRIFWSVFSPLTTKRLRWWCPLQSWSRVAVCYVDQYDPDGNETLKWGNSL
jgi:hypothetical protein